MSQKFSVTRMTDTDLRRIGIVLYCQDLNWRPAPAYWMITQSGKICDDLGVFITEEEAHARIHELSRIDLN